jgi:hypothetical protein
LAKDAEKVARLPLGSDVAKDVMKKIYVTSSGTGTCETRLKITGRTGNE